MDTDSVGLTAYNGETKQSVRATDECEPQKANGGEKNYAFIFDIAWQLVVITIYSLTQDPTFTL